MAENTTIHVQLTAQEAEAYAQFLKRICFGDYLGCAVDREEAHVIVAAGEKVRSALALNGFAPR